MQRSPHMRRLAVGVVLSLALAACAGDDDDPVAEETPIEAESPDEPEMTEAPEPTETEPEETEAAGGANVDGVLTLGSILPQTGDLSVLGEPMIQAVNLAIQQINEAGGVLGQDVVLVEGDSGTNEQVASETLTQQLSDNIDGFVGAASSRVSLAIIDSAIDAEVTMCSPSNTGSALTTAEDDIPGFYFRSAPPDNLQGPALADVMIGDGNSEIGIIALNDEYGQGFADEVSAAVEEAGGTVVANVAYDPAGSEFSADVSELLAANPQAIALLSFPDTGSQILRELLTEVEPSQIYTADGMQSGDVPGLVAEGQADVLDGMKGTAPSSQGSEAFTQAFEEFAPGVAQIFSSHAYDCAIITALAAAQAGTDDPTVFHQDMVEVTRDGEKCSDVASCLELIEAGEDIDYDGASGPLDFIDEGEPAAGTYDVWEFDSSQEGGIATLDTVDIAAEDA